MRILVCGGRDYLDYNYLDITLFDILDIGITGKDHTIIQGEAKGADFLSKVFAHEYELKVESFPANWKKYGKAAGSIRNQQMLDEGKPDLVVAFPGGTGTADMVRRAKKAGVEVLEIEV